MGKKMFRVTLAVFLLIIMTGCSKTTPTGEMVNKIGTEWKCLAAAYK